MIYLFKKPSGNQYTDPSANNLHITEVSELVRPSNSNVVGSDSFFHRVHIRPTVLRVLHTSKVGWVVRTFLWALKQFYSDSIRFTSKGTLSFKLLVLILLRRIIWRVHQTGWECLSRVWRRTNRFTSISRFSSIVYRQYRSQ